MTVKRANEDEIDGLRKIIRLNIITIVWFILFFPVCILFFRIFPRMSTLLIVCYICLGGLSGMLSSFQRCPRCGEYFNMYDPLSWDVFLSDYGYKIPRSRPYMRCVHCGLHLPIKKKAARSKRKANKTAVEITKD